MLFVWHTTPVVARPIGFLFDFRIFMLGREMKRFFVRFERAWPDQAFDV